jgi:hypothetical protein
VVELERSGYVFVTVEVKLPQRDIIYVEGRCNRVVVFVQRFPNFVLKICHMELFHMDMREGVTIVPNIELGTQPVLVVITRETQRGINTGVGESK